MRRFVVLLALAAPACGGNDPYCGLPLDVTGREVIYCPGVHDTPVCDLEGMHTHFEVSATGRRELVGGVHATCDEEGEVTCPAGTMGEAYCITDPEL